MSSRTLAEPVPATTWTLHAMAGWLILNLVLCAGLPSPMRLGHPCRLFSAWYPWPFLVFPFRKQQEVKPMSSVT